MIIYEGTEVLFVTKPPYTQGEREQFFSWLREHTSLDVDTCRGIALTGEQLPCLLSSIHRADDFGEAERQLKTIISDRSAIRCTSIICSH